MRKFLSSVTAIALLSLSGCLTDAGDATKAFLYDKGADAGNNYCVVRDESIVESIGTKINNGLHNAGGEFDLKVEITCHNKAAAE